MQRKPSHLGSYCQPPPAGSSSASSASMGARASTARTALAPAPAFHCAGRRYCYAGGTSGGKRMNVEAETARYIDSLGADNLQRAAAYTAGNHWHLLWGLL